MTFWGRHGSMHADWEPIFSGIRRAGIPGKTRENMPLLAGKGNQAY